MTQTQEMIPHACSYATTQTHKHDVHSAEQVPQTITHDFANRPRLLDCITLSSAFSFPLDPSLCRSLVSLSLYLSFPLSFLSLCFLFYLSFHSQSTTPFIPSFSFPPSPCSFIFYQLSLLLNHFRQMGFVYVCVCVGYLLSRSLLI